MRKFTATTLGIALSLLSAVPTFAATAVDLCPPGAACNATTDPGIVIGNIISILFVIGAVVAVVFLMWAGIKWITANGDKTKVQSARETIIGAIIGLVVVFAAYFIINFILMLLFGQGLGKLSIPTMFK